MFEMSYLMIDGSLLLTYSHGQKISEWSTNYKTSLLQKVWLYNVFISCPLKM